MPKNSYSSHSGRSAIARRVIMAGTGKSDGIQSHIGYFGGSKKGGSAPTATAFMRPTYLASHNSLYPTYAKKPDYKFVFRTQSRPWGGLSYVNA